MIAYLQNGSFNGQQLLSPSAVDQMLTFQIPSIDGTQGLNWYTEEIYLSGGGIINLWGHNGGESGASTDLYINPDNQIGIVVLSNGEGDNLYVVDELYDYALSLTTTGVGNPDCEPVSIDETNQNEALINVFPNPANNSFTVGSEHGGLLVLYSFLGKKILQQEVCSLEEIDVSQLESGNYLIRLNNTYLKICIQ